MKWYAVQDPAGVTWYVQADNPNTALLKAKQFFANNGWGATDVGQLTIAGEAPADYVPPKDNVIAGPPPAAGGDTAITTPPPGGPIGGTEEEQNQRDMSQFRRALDAAGVTPRGNPFARYFSQQFEPVQDVRTLHAALGQNPGEMQDYTAGLMGYGKGFGSNITARAGEVWQSFLDQIQGRQPRATTLGAFGESNPDATTGGLIGDVARRSARNKYGITGASFLPGGAEAFQRYRAQPVGGPDTEQELALYLKRLYGI